MGGAVGPLSRESETRGLRARRPWCLIVGVVIRPPQESAPPAASRRAGLVLALGIGSIVVGVAVWVFTFSFRISRVADIVLAILVVVGAAAGQLAVVLSLAPAQRPRSAGQVAGLTCGLAGLGVLLLFVALVLITYP